MKRRVVFSFVGIKLDSGVGNERWLRWRPTVGLCQQAGLFVDRLELIRDNHSAKIANQLTADIETVSPATKVVPHIVNMQNPWDFSEVYTRMREFARVYPFDVDREDYFVNITTGTHVYQICWFLLAEARFMPAKLLQLSPPRAPKKQSDYAGTHSIIDLDLSRYDAIATRFKAEDTIATSFLKSGIPTQNKAFNALIEQIEKIVVRSKAPILVTGPTGAGKSLLAKRIFELKKSRHQVQGPLVEVNCATLRGDQAMSALFGHVKGAFTGAASERTGLMKLADKGLLFLDEIGELGLDEQAMCLRAIEEKRFLRVGADKETETDFQLIAGSNRNLAADVKTGRFREDLFARINLWTFELPALKDRREDIEPNLDYELRHYAEREGDNVTFNREARRNYLGFACSAEALWHGNFRDLHASVVRMATLAPSGRINEAIVEQEVGRLKLAWSNVTVNQRYKTISLSAVEAILGTEKFTDTDLFDLYQLAAVIEICRGCSSLSEAGRELFAISRKAKASTNDADRLRKLLARFDLDFEMIVSA